MSCACQLINYTLATEENVGNVRVCACCNRFQITWNVFYHNTQLKNFEYSLKVHFFKDFFKSFLGEKYRRFYRSALWKKSIWKFLVNGTVSVTEIRVKVYQIEAALISSQALYHLATAFQALLDILTHDFINWYVW